MSELARAADETRALIAKCGKVAYSCKTREQRAVAGRYLHLVWRRLSPALEWDRGASLHLGLIEALVINPDS